MRADAHDAVPASAVWRRAALASAVAGVLIAVPTALVLLQGQRHERQSLLREGRALVELDREFLTHELLSVRSDLHFLAQQPLLEGVLAGDLEALRAVEREYQGFARSKPLYEQIRILDAGGSEIVRVNRRGDQVAAVPRAELQSKADRYYFRQAIGLAPGAVFVSPFDLNVEHGRIEQPPNPVIRLATPLGDASGPRGLLVLNYAGARLLTQLRRVAAGSRGDTLLVNRDGEYLQTPDPGHEWGWLLGHAVSFRSDHPEVWERLRSAPRIDLVHGDALFAAEWVPLAEGASDASSDVAIVSRMQAPRTGGPLPPAGLALLSAGVLAIIVALSYVWARAGVIHRRHEQQIAESEERLRVLSSRLLAAQEEERRSLSRLLHDELGQSVTAITLDLKAAAKRAGQAPGTDELRRAIRETEVLLGSLHEIATRVRPSVLDDLGLADAIESHVSEYGQRTGIAVALELDLAGPELSGPVAENLYRVVQEALSNVAAHADSDTVRLSLKSDEREIRLHIEDDGRGFDPEQRKGAHRLGILGMRERVELLGGGFEFESAPGRGTRLDVRLPRSPA